MKNSLKTWVGLAAGILAISALMVGVAGTAALAQYVEEPAPPGVYTGALDIRIYSEIGDPNPPGELLLSDPAGNMTGRDPRSHYAYREIPGVSYGWRDVAGVPGQEEEFMHVRNPLNGYYSLRVVGTDYGTYVVMLRAYDASRNTADVQLSRLRIQPGEVQHFVITYSNLGGARVTIRRTAVTE